VALKGRGLSAAAAADQLSSVSRSDKNQACCQGGIIMGDSFMCDISDLIIAVAAVSSGGCKVI
jgi:hypothetical protein